MTNEELEELGFNIVELNVGDMVSCDSCNEDYTNSPEVGGVLFSRTAVCPKCAPRLIANAKKYREEKYLTFPNEGESFYEFVLRIR